MAHIVAGILSLTQYLKCLEETPTIFDVAYCQTCGKAEPWRHGGYFRKADRQSSDDHQSLNPIFIQRFYCAGCGKTCSVLPECMPPRRWYLWAIQQMALLLWLSGKSVYATAKEVAKVATPSRHTIKRWVRRFQEQFHLHKDALCQAASSLGRTLDFSAFWQTCLQTLSLGAAMQLCHVSGVAIP